jgi:hypothetical protein
MGQIRRHRVPRDCRRRDALQAQTEEALKDLSKRVQDCREKLARLEGPMQPAKPAPDKKSGD